jgi:WD40 repeat protein
MLERNSGQVILWETATWQRRPMMQEPSSPVRRIAFAGAYLAGYESGNRVCVWDSKDGTIRTQHSLGEGEAAANAIAFSSDGNLLAVSLGDSPGEIRVYDLTTGKLRGILEGLGSMINALAFSSNSTQVAAGFADTTALVWDLSSGRLIHRLRGHTATVRSVAFSPSGRRLVTGGDDGNIWIWKLDTEEELLSLSSRAKGPVHRIRFSPDGGTILAVKKFAVPSFFESILPSAKVPRAR